jgi:hypothetical protein
MKAPGVRTVSAVVQWCLCMALAVLFDQARDRVYFLALIWLLTILADAVPRRRKRRVHKRVMVRRSGGRNPSTRGQREMLSELERLYRLNPPPPPQK